MGQLSLDFDEAQAEEARDLTIQEKFARFHESHPEVFTLFKRFAHEARAAGRERFGAKAIFERIRWFCSVEQKGGAFQLNNVFTSRYVRLLVAEDPSFATFFETRTLTSE